MLYIQTNAQDLHTEASSFRLWGALWQLWWALTRYCVRVRLEPVETRKYAQAEAVAQGVLERNSDVESLIPESRGLIFLAWCQICQSKQDLAEKYARGSRDNFSGFEEDNRLAVAMVLDAQGWFPGRFWSYLTQMIPIKIW